MNLRRCTRSRDTCSSAELAKMCPDDKVLKLPIELFTPKHKAPHGPDARYYDYCDKCLRRTRARDWESLKKKRGLPKPKQVDKRMRGNDIGGFIPLTLEEWKGLLSASG